MIGHSDTVKQHDNESAARSKATEWFDKLSAH